MSLPRPRCVAGTRVTDSHSGWTMSFKTTGYAVLVAAVAAGGGYAAWNYFGHGCCRATDTSAEGPKAEGTAPAPDDAALIASQGYCPAMPETKLGEMGDPFKVMVTGKDGVEQPVFVCCKGCKRKVLADPNRTLAKAAELKAGVASGK